MPKLRFKADDGSEFPEWKEKKVSETCTIVGGGTPSTNCLEYWNGDIPWISSSDVIEDNIFSINKHRYITEEAVDKSATKKIPKDSVLIVSRVGVGKVALADEELCTSQDFTNLINISECPKFFAYYFLKRMQDEAINTQGTSIKGIPSKEIQEYMIKIPYIEEQQKIADFFSTIDTIIADCQSEIDTWEKYKRGVMQQLFNQRVRFKAYDGSKYPEWEKSNLGFHCEFYNGDRGENYPSQKDLKKEGIPFINAGDLVDGKIALDTANKITKEKYDSMSGAKIKEHDIVYCLRGSIGKNAIVEHINDGTVASSLVVIRAKDINFKYLFHFLNSDLERKQRILNNEGCAQPNLSAKNVSNFMIPVPCLEEQQKIADCLSAFDEVIDKSKQKLEAYKQLKKGLLQQMFV